VEFENLFGVMTLSVEVVTVTTFSLIFAVCFHHCLDRSFLLVVADFKGEALTFD